MPNSLDCSSPLENDLQTVSRAERRQARLIVACWVIALGLGAIRAWADRHAMNADGISYLDIAEAYTRGDWSNVVNGYWSPLYSWLLALGLVVFRPSAYWEAAVVHLVSFAIYCFALACFHYFWVGLLRYRNTRANHAPQGETIPLPEWAWLALGLALFMWSSLNLITLRLVTPDLCVAGLVYLISGVVVRIRTGSTGYGTFVTLGASVALAYLAKAFMLPIGFVFIGMALLAAGQLRKAVPRVLATCLAFAVLAGPWVTALSLQKGRLTFGEAGKMNYAALITGFYPWDHWRGQPPGTGTPKHPTRQLLEHPEVYEFATPIIGSYPLWYDPSYWHEGVVPSFNLQGHIRALKQTSDAYFDVFIHSQGGMVFCILVLFIMSRRWRAALKDVAGCWFLLLPTVAALGLYAIIWVEPRLVAGFVVVLWSVILCAVQLPDSPDATRMMRCTCIAALLALATAIGYESLPALRRGTLDLRCRTDTASHDQWKIANELHRMGLKPGDKVAHIGQALKPWSYWARLAQVQIIAEMRPAESFWGADDSVRARVIDAFARTGARAVVTRAGYSDERSGTVEITAVGWRQVGDSHHYVYFLGQ